MSHTDHTKINNTENNLDVIFSPEGVYCTITDENNNELLHRYLNVVMDVKTDMRRVKTFLEQPELEIIGENLNIYIENSQYQLIPSELYRVNDIEKIFEITFGKSENEVIKSAVLPKWNLLLAYRIPINISDFITSNFPEIDSKHIIFNLLKIFIKRSDNAVYLNLRANSIDIALVKDNKLQLLNSFDIKNDNDILYFTMNIFEQFQLDIQHFKLKIKKNKSEKNSTIDLLKQYIVNVEIEKLRN